MFNGRCKKCLISKNYPDTEFDDKGICSYCNGNKSQKISNELKDRIKRKNELRKDFESAIKKCKGKKYDCIVGLSGGKDSIYLLYIMKEKYGLNCLTFTVDNGLVSNYAKENIEIAVKALDLDHVYCRPSHDFYKKFYNNILKNMSEKGYMNTVCGICSELFHSTALKLATSKDIPLVFIGYSPDQVTKYFYEIPSEEIARSRVPKILNSNEFTVEDRDYFWNPTRYKIKNYPRVLFPYHVIPYPGVEKIEAFLREKKLINVSNPLYTNCSLSWLTLYLDLKKNGYNPLESNYSELIRSGKAKRWRWLPVFSFGNFLLKKRLVKRKDIKKTLSFLDIKLSEAL